MNYQFPEEEAVEHLEVSLLCHFLLNVQLPPEIINTAHVQQLGRVNLPCIAEKTSPR